MERIEWEKLKHALLLKRSNIPNLLVLGFDLGLMGISLSISPMAGSFHILSAFFSVFFFTLALVHIYLLKHEATHSALFQNRKINNLLGHIFGWLILMPFLSRQRSHLLHHTWTGHPIGDPSNERMIRRFTVMTESEERKLEFIWRFWIPMLAINDRIGLWIDPFSKRHPARSQTFLKKERRAAGIYIFGYIASGILLIKMKLLLNFSVWYFSSLILLFIIEELINLPHHAETPLLNLSDRALPFWKQETVTHSCRAIPVWSQFCLLNFNLHTAHHYFPMLPWHLLRVANQNINNLKRNTVNSEIEWSLSHRNRPLLSIMGHYFDKIERKSAPHPLVSKYPITTIDLPLMHPKCDPDATHNTL